MIDAFQPDWFSKPGDTLLTLMEQRELTSEALARRLEQGDFTLWEYCWARDLTSAHAFLASW